MGDSRTCKHPRSTMMGKTAIMLLGLALLVTISSVDAETAEQRVEASLKAKLMQMSKSQLADVFLKTQQQTFSTSQKLLAAKKAASNTKSELDAARTQIVELHAQLMAGKRSHKFNEKHREMREGASKAAAKKKTLAKRNAKLKKKEKLSDILMDHGAAYLAMKAAKKEGIHGKHHLRKISMAAAQKAVHKVLADQEKLVKKAAKKWTETAIKKFPPTILLARRTNTPNHFTAPPTIHLGGMMEEAHPKKHHKKAAKHAKHAKKHAKKFVKHHKKAHLHKMKAAHHAGRARGHKRFHKLCKKYKMHYCAKRHAKLAKKHAAKAKKHKAHKKAAKKHLKAFKKHVKKMKKHKKAAKKHHKKGKKQSNKKIAKHLRKHAKVAAMKAKHFAKFAKGKHTKSKKAKHHAKKAAHHAKHAAKHLHKAANAIAKGNR